MSDEIDMNSETELRMIVECLDRYEMPWPEATTGRGIALSPSLRVALTLARLTDDPTSPARRTLPEPTIDELLDWAGQLVNEAERRGWCHAG